MTLRVRFAPSPTGFLHVGGARTALFNWLLARGEGGIFALRIEDTDRERSSPEMVHAILDGLTWLGLDWDEGPVFQSEGIERHRADVATLLTRGAAYRDFIAPNDLAAVREADPARAVRYPRLAAESMPPGEAEERAAAGEPHAVRFLMPDGETEWEDRVHGSLRFRNADIEDLVLLRTDGTPTYNLAVASDDAEMRITLVIRGDDHLSNTPKQILIHRALGRPVPEFAHVPMILGPDGKRLSKRHGATAIGEYARLGILPAAMMNFLALLGWSPGTDEEVMSPSELTEKFSLERVLKKSAVFNVRKLDWLNGQHLARVPLDLLADEVAAAVGSEEIRAILAESPGLALALTALLRSRARNVHDLAAQVEQYATDPVAYDPAAVAAHWEKDRSGVHTGLSELRRRYSRLSDWNQVSLEEALRSVAEERGEGAGRLIHPLRVAVTGHAVSPGLFEVLEALGRERVMARLATALEALQSPPDRRS